MLHQTSEVRQGRCGLARGLTQQAPEIGELVRGLAGGGAEIDREGGRLGDLPADEALLGVRIPDAMALVEDHQGPGPLRRAVPGERVVLGAGRAPVAGGGRRHQRLGPLVVGERDRFLAEARQGDRAPPLGHRALGADDEDFALRHRRDRAPDRQGLAETGRVTQQKSSTPGRACGENRIARRTLMRARNERFAGDHQAIGPRTLCAPDFILFQASTACSRSLGTALTIF